MSVQLSFRPEASADVVEAFSWYQAQRAGLGAEFRTDVDATLSLHQRMSEAGPVVYRGLRRTLLRHFPYAIYYSGNGAVLEVRAVLHQHRPPPLGGSVGET